MSRSWERKVRKNMAQANKTRKKTGSAPISGVTPGSDSIRFKGQNFIMPATLILFIASYSFLMTTSKDYVPDMMFWLTIGCYVVLAMLFFFRKPYLAVGKDFVQSRRITGDKRLQASEIKEIRVHKDYVTIFPPRGAAWTYTRMLNRFNTDAMAKELEALAQKHNINYVRM